MATGRWQKLRTLLPGLELLSRRPRVSRDLLAAFAVGSMLIPQGMAFAQLAGLPPGVGLWTSVAALLGYALFGPSRQTMVGPEAGTALLAYAVLSSAGLAPGDPRYGELAAAVAVILAVLLAVSGLLRLGAIADFLSQPLLIGYLNGVAIILVVSQLARITGMEEAPRELWDQLRHFVAKLSTIHWVTTLLGGGTLALLLAARRWLPRLPAAAIAVALSIALAYLFDFKEKGVPLVGRFSASPPSFGLPTFPPWSELLRLAPGILGLGLLCYVSGFLTSRAFADKRGYHLDANQEFFGISAANLFAGLVGGFPITGSDSRTAVNDMAGGTSQWVSIFSAGVVLLVIAFLIPVVAYLPEATLAAVVIAAGLSLIDLRALRQVFHARPSEAFVSLITTAAVLAIGILEGILIAVTLAVLDMVRVATHPHDTVLGKVAGKPGYPGIDSGSPSEVLPGLLLYRFDGPLFFANARRMRERIDELLDALRERSEIDAGRHGEEILPPFRLVVLDAGAIFDIDYTGATSLHRLHHKLERRGISLAIAEPHEPVRRVLRRTKVLPLLEVFPTVDDAVRFYLRETKRQGESLEWTRIRSKELPL